MATTYKADAYVNTPYGNTGHGFHKGSVHLHATSGSISTWALNDSILMGYLPANAVVVGVILKAQGQLDSNGSPAITFDVGITGTLQLWKAAITTVGRAATVTSDSTIATTGGLYKTTAKTAVIVTVHAAAATAVAGVIEVDIEYYVEDAGATAP